MSDIYFTVGLIIAIIILGMMLGVLLLFAHTIMPGLKRVNDETFVKSFRSIDAAIMNPLFMLQFFGPVFLLGGLCWYAYTHGLPGAGWLLSGSVLYVIAVMITMTVNVPLNDSLKKVDPAADEMALSQARKIFNEPRWGVANMLRTYATVGAIGCVVMALYAQI